MVSVSHISATPNDSLHWQSYCQAKIALVLGGGNSQPLILWNDHLSLLFLKTPVEKTGLDVEQSISVARRNKTTVEFNESIKERTCRADIIFLGSARFGMKLRDI